MTRAQLEHMKTHGSRVGLSILGILLLGLLGCRPGGKKPAAAAEKPPIPVRTATVDYRAVPRELGTFGNAQALASVEIKSQVSGLLQKVAFTEGQDVQPGALLFSIDPRPMEASVQLAQATLARDTTLQADAAREAVRQETLFKKGLAAQDMAERTQAAADALSSTVRADEAALTNALLQLDYCSIRAPIGGRTGERRVDEGNLVRAGDQTLTTIHQIQPIDVAFTIPQQELDGILAAQAAAPLEVRAFVPGKPDSQETGTVSFVDNAVDGATGTVRLKARFENARRSLWPGRFLQVILQVGLDQQALTVPAAAVMTGQKGPFVYVVKPDQTAENRNVRVTRTREEWAVIADGLQPGEAVVIDGQQRLAPGLRVAIPSSGKPAQGRP